MTLDSREKRAAALQFQQPWLFAPPLPNAAIGTADRLQIAKLYSGIPLVVPVGLNSRERRASALQFMQTGVFVPPLPDATLSSGDRRHLRGLYDPSSGGSGSTGGGTIWDDGDTVWPDALWDQPTFLLTRDKRAAALEFLQTGRRVLPLADATIGSGDRASIAHLYRGITLQSSLGTHIDTRNKRASALQFMQTGVFAPPLPDTSIASGADREHLTHLYSGIPIIFTLPLYTGSGALMRTSSVITADAAASNVAYAGNSAAFIKSLCVLLASGNYSEVLNPTGSGQAVSNSVITASGSYNGDTTAGLASATSISTLTGSGTYLDFTGLSSGSSFLLSNVIMNGIGSYGGGTTDFIAAMQAMAVELGPERLVTFIETMRAMAAVLCGTTSGTPTEAGTMGYHAIGNPTVQRVEGEEDGRGTRDSVTLTLDQ